MAQKHEDAGLDAWARLLTAQALAVREIESRLKAAGQPPLAWYDVLLELERAGGRLRIGSLAERLVIAPYNATRLLDRMEGAGLLLRERVPGDRRGAFAALTDQGRALRREAWPDYRRAILESFADGLADDEAEALVRILGRVIARLREQRADAPSF